MTNSLPYGCGETVEGDIIRQLNKNTLIGSDSRCHLDPDLRKEVRPRSRY